MNLAVGDSVPLGLLRQTCSEVRPAPGDQALCHGDCRHIIDVALRKSYPKQTHVNRTVLLLVQSVSKGGQAITPCSEVWVGGAPLDAEFTDIGAGVSSQCWQSPGVARWVPGWSSKRQTLKGSAFEMVANSS